MPPSRPSTSALVRSLSARAPRVAQVWACVSLTAAMLTSLVVQGLTSPDGTNASAVAATALVVGLAALVLRQPAARVAPWLGLLPLLGIVVIVRLDLPSHDAGVTGQVFFVIPVIWAAVHLRAGGTVLVTAATTAGEAVVVFSLLPAEQAVVDLSYLTVLFVLLATVLNRAAANQERLVERLRVLAGVDPLTGLATRRVLDRATADLRAAPGEGATLLLLDLDRFKTINDRHGHLGGDAALQHVADLLRRCCRTSDVIARMGGDELAVLMPACSGAAARDRAQAIVDTVRETPLRLPDGSLVQLSVSAGTAPLAAGSSPADDPYALADAALYAAKRAGRDRVVATPVTC